jgi:N-sulfoglucosamine sulfohydrolase
LLFAVVRTFARRNSYRPGLLAPRGRRKHASTFTREVRHVSGTAPSGGVPDRFSGKRLRSHRSSRKEKNPAGRAYASFAKFLEDTPADTPFCYWFGSFHPHRPYAPGSWKKSGKWNLSDAIVPAYLPDTPEVRGDLLDYYAAIELFDRQAAEILAALDAAGRRDNTLVAITSDNGMSFPRAKCNLYDWGTRMPLAIRWPGRVKPGSRSDGFVSHTDLAPTFLQAAGREPAPSMTGHSLLPLPTGGGSSQNDAVRSRVFTGRERHSPSREHALGYPCRALRTRDFLYIRNFRPDRWPAGDPPGSADVDPSPTRDFMVRNRESREIQRYSRMAFDRRPEEELYDLRKDPAQVKNVAGLPQYRDAQKKAAAALTAYLGQTGDPRIGTDGDVFDRYPFWGSNQHE